MGEVDLRHLFSVKSNMRFKLIQLTQNAPERGVYPPYLVRQTKVQGEYIKNETKFKSSRV